MPSRTAAFIEPMECLPVPRVPEGPEWTYEIKLDGYRLEAVHSGRKTTLYSRRQNVLNSKFPYIAKSLDGLPDATVIDGELVALGSDGRPNFNLLQNFRAPNRTSCITCSTFLFTRATTLPTFRSQSEETFFAPLLNPGSISISQRSQQIEQQRRCSLSFASRA